MEQTPPRDPDRIVRAAEIALRLSDDDRAAIRDDPALAAMIAQWEDDFGQLADTLDPVEPSPRVLAMLQDELARRAAPATAPAAALWRGLLGSLRFWRALAGTGLAAAALALVLWAREPGAPAPQLSPPSRTLLVSSLLPKEGSPLFVAAYDASRTTLLVVPAAARKVEEGTPFLWLVPEDDGDPIPLGMLDPDRFVVLAVAPERARHIDGQAGLVITLEPNGAPTEAARGPVIAHGRFLSL